MRFGNVLKTVLGPLLVLLCVGFTWATREQWKPWLLPRASGTNDADDDKKPEAEGAQRVKISEQARRNLRLSVKEATLTTYWKRLTLPGTVIDRPGHSDHGIPAPISGVVTQIHAVPGKTVKAGDALFRLRPVSESFQSSQMELYKATREVEIIQKERKRLTSVPGAVIPPTKLLELEYQEERLNVTIKAHRQDLHVRQLTREQIEQVEKGTFVTEMVIKMPERIHADVKDDTHGVEFDVQELKVNLGDYVQTGQVMAYVADHRKLYVEGRALKQEAKLLAQAAREGWPVDAEFTEPEPGVPGESISSLNIEFLGTTMDASGLTLPVFVPFDNPLRAYGIKDKTYRAGQFRPGQKVLLKVAVMKVENVFVLPVTAVAREGPEAYVFCQNGDEFERRPVHVLYEDFDEVVIANDGSILAGVHYVAQNGAASLNRVLKAGQSEGGGHHHHHH